MTARVPTVKQYAILRTLGNGCAFVVAKKRFVEPLLRRGWVTADHHPDKHPPYSWVRITPDGLRALADAVEKYGLPDIRAKAAA